MASQKISAIFLGLVICNILVDCKIPDYIKKCKNKADSKCLMENFSAIMTYLSENDEKDYKIPSTKSRFLELIDLQGTKDLRIILHNTTFRGIDTSTIRFFDFKDNVLFMKMQADALIFDGKYEINGKLLVLHIEGQGNFHCHLTNYAVDYTARLKIEERNGKKYYYVENSVEGATNNITSIEKFTFQFDNLFNDTAISAEINGFMNENWMNVFMEVKEALELTGTYMLLNPIINSYLRHIPIDELFLDR